MTETPSIATMIEQLQSAQDVLSVLKERESKLRLEVVKRLSDPARVEGTERITLPNDWQVNIVKTQRYHVTNRNGEVNYLSAIIPSETFNDLFRIKYEISVPAYRKLSDEQRTVIDYCLTISDGMPQVEILQPTMEKVI